MPAHTDAPDARHLQPPAVDLEAVPILLQAEAVEAVATFEARIAGCLSRFHAAEEVLERLVEIGDDHLQDVAVNLRRIGVRRLPLLDVAQLLELADGSAVRLVSVL